MAPYIDTKGILTCSWDWGWC